MTFGYALLILLLMRAVQGSLCGCDCYGAENTFFAGDCTRICFTDGQTSRVEYYPTVGGKYDGSEY